MGQDTLGVESRYRMLSLLAKTQVAHLDRVHGRCEIHSVCRLGDLCDDSVIKELIRREQSRGPSQIVRSDE